MQVQRVSAPAIGIAAAADEVSESAANGTAVGLTALASDADVTATTTYSLDDNAGCRFTIDASTGVVTVANTGLLDAETTTTHSITTLNEATITTMATGISVVAAAVRTVVVVVVVV